MTDSNIIPKPGILFGTGHWRRLRERSMGWRFIPSSAD